MDYHADDMSYKMASQRYSRCKLGGMDLQAGDKTLLGGGQPSEIEMIIADISMLRDRVHKLASDLEENASRLIGEEQHDEAGDNAQSSPMRSGLVGRVHDAIDALRWQITRAEVAALRTSKL